MKFRAGRKVARTLYHQQGPEPSDSDPIVGLVDTPEIAEEIVTAVNAHERARIRAAILAEIDDMDPDGRMRHLMEDQAREGGDPGHAGNAWWRAYCHVGGLMVALACLEPDSPQEEQ